MEVKDLRDLIKVIHDSGDCGQALSDVLEMANKICEQPSDLDIVQKALDKTGLELRVGKDWILVCGEDEYSGDDALEVYYEGWGSLLTWAKQTIGE